MMKNKALNSICLMMFSVSVMQSQSPEAWTKINKEEMSKVFEEMNNWFKNTSCYSLTVTHASYEDYKTITPFEISVGYFKNDKNNYHSFLLGIHSIQNSDYKIVIDTSQKIIMAANTDNTIWSTYALEDYSTILNSCSAIKVQNLSNYKRYRVEFDKEAQIAAYEFLLNPEGMIKEIVWYYGKEIKKDEDDSNSIKVKPRLSITFSGYKSNPTLSYIEEFDERNYFTKKENKLLVAEKYKQFKLNDQRFILN